MLDRRSSVEKARLACSIASTDSSRMPNCIVGGLKQTGTRISRPASEVYYQPTKVPQILELRLWAGWWSVRYLCKADPSDVDAGQSIGGGGLHNLCQVFLNSSRVAVGWGAKVDRPGRSASPRERAGRRVARQPGGTARWSVNRSCQFPPW